MPKRGTFHGALHEGPAHYAQAWDFSWSPSLGACPLCPSVGLFMEPFTRGLPIMPKRGSFLTYAQAWVFHE
jgi:hypothetical protein